jgi:hypothetical protein
MRPVRSKRPWLVRRSLSSAAAELEVVVDGVEEQSAPAGVAAEAFPRPAGQWGAVVAGGWRRGGVAGEVLGLDVDPRHPSLYVEQVFDTRVPQENFGCGATILRD